jgi:acetylornithine deacetylase/succinyl-diaminopimelate desuccinylase-like protein
VIEGEVIHAKQTRVLGVPIVNHDNAQHAANENLRMQNLFDGIEIYANLLARTGRRSDLGQTSIAP